MRTRLGFCCHCQSCQCVVQDLFFAFPLYGLTKRQKVCYTIYARFHCRFSPSIFHMPAEKFSSAELKHNFRIGPHGMKAMM